MIDPALRGMQGVITTTPHYNPLLLQDTKADVTGIGVMLYEILTGTLPFDDVPWQYAGSEVGGEVERLCDRVVVVSHGHIVAEGTVDALNAQCGQSDFEETFVRLAFTPEEGRAA